MQKTYPVILVLFLAACSLRAPAATPTPESTPTPTATPTPVPAAVTTTRPPDPYAAFEAWYAALQIDDFPGMYAMLTHASREQIDEETFTRRFIDALAMATVPTGAIAGEVLEVSLHPDAAQVGYRQTWTSVLFGELVREHQMFLELEDGAWRVLWSAGLVLPELEAGNVLRRLYYPPPERGDIYDREGNPMVAFSDAYAVGIVPALIGEDTEGEMLSAIGRATGLPAEFIFTLYQAAGYDYGFYIPITDASAAQFNPFYNSATSYDAVSVSFFSTRYYLGVGDAAHLLGYTSFVQPDELDELTRNGYWWTSRVPRAGVELWADEYLTGGQGGALFVDDAGGAELEKLGENFVEPAGSVYLTVDRELQSAVQDALFGLRGAVVVMEQDTGRILAMASAPTYSPNLFDPANTNSLFTSPFNDLEEPVINRAINGQYPLGSVFKIITMAAALETGVFTVEDTYDCQYTFEELLPNGPILYDWTWERNEESLAEDGNGFPPSGMLTLPQGLMRSCNPWFYHIGLTLFEEGLTTALSEMARGFGLGAPTGVIGAPGESAGRVDDPSEILESTNLAIGQGDLLVTPLQVANFVAAVANGGTLYVPQTVERVLDADGNVIYEFEPQVLGELPVSPETLAEIRAAMVLVTQNSRGTAEFVFRNFSIDAAGKTGTAEVGGGLDPHAWFVAFTQEGREDLPDIVVAVLVENRGEGSEWAAPVARRVLEAYFFDRPIRGYPWEIRIGVPEWMAFPDPEEVDEDADED
ncbi:MAG TPA: penicillin-binding transpeptidase domain-containing protein [Anaerolineales bacterium]|nr:penicillin-binding transpeptidase domain-containing protein [Anaerolineales bacterium]